MSYWKPEIVVFCCCCCCVVLVALVMDWVFRLLLVFNNGGGWDACGKGKAGMRAGCGCRVHLTCDRSIWARGMRISRVIGLSAGTGCTSRVHLVRDVCAPTCALSRARQATRLVPVVLWGSTSCCDNNTFFSAFVGNLLTCNIFNL